MAVLHAGPRAALCGLSALRAEGLRGYEPDRVHVVVPHGSEVPRLLGVRVVESRDHGGQHREVSAWWADMDRQNEVVLATDGIVLRFPALVVRLFPERVADQIRRALVASGWRG